MKFSETFARGRQYAVWEMEAIPCTDANDFCDRFSELPTPMDNRDYQELLQYLLSIGFVVRDIRNPDNYGSELTALKFSMTP